MNNEQTDKFWYESSSGRLGANESGTSFANPLTEEKENMEKKVACKLRFVVLEGEGIVGECLKIYKNFNTSKINKLISGDTPTIFYGSLEGIKEALGFYVKELNEENEPAPMPRIEKGLEVGYYIIYEDDLRTGNGEDFFTETGLRSLEHIIGHPIPIYSPEPKVEYEAVWVRDHPREFTFDELPGMIPMPKELNEHLRLGDVQAVMKMVLDYINEANKSEIEIWTVEVREK